MAYETIAASDNTALLGVNMANFTKLTADNFLMWSRQVHALLNGYALSGYLDGTIVAPPLTITTNGAVTTNPDCTHWQQQDQLIYSALLGLISVSVQPILSATSTSAEIWEKFSSTYANPSRGHLALLGKPMDHDDQIEFIVDGLSEDYKQVVDQIQARDVTPSITEVHEKLLNYEIKLLTMVSSSSITPISANTASYRPSGNHNYNSNNNQNTHSCGQPRHIYRGNYQQHQHSHQRSDHPSHGYQGKCRICGVFGHSASRCSQLAQYSSSQPRANLATTPTSDPWLLDSGATHHIASDLANLSLQQPYNGGEAVVIGNGSGLPITHTGSTFLPSLTRLLYLNNVLYVRDLRMGVPLLRDSTRNELYEWPISLPFASTFFGQPLMSKPPQQIGMLD
ncbi:PREDICTED: uncharacterized protein LOC104715039 [Camelina sativa]|uniref:Uncharacterized protein LOC104715039 n=1 Tax=Camelina sativa TaxID=90675 RepID=A0ABM0TSX0_CAMSA|nr:PREDICTED: uncharacterized protein LOC104715039 [Camelina sativa]